MNKKFYFPIGLTILTIYLIYQYFKFHLLDYETTLCKYKRYGCCKDKITPKYDPDRTNCRGF